MIDINHIYQGDCIEVMKTWPETFIQTVVTSPPYWGLRDYGVDGQIGVEKTPQQYVETLVTVFREICRVLRDDGTLWLNIGDSYTSGGRNTHGTREGYKQETNGGSMAMQFGRPELPVGLKPKDMVGIPWRVAFALQADGWYLRSDIIWAKPNPMPESVTDRPTKAHEYLFLLTKSERYYYDAEAIKETGSENKPWSEKSNGGTKAMLFRNDGGNKSGLGKPAGYNRVARDKQRGHGRRHAGFNERWDEMEREEQCSGMRNKRSVWTVSTSPFPEAHFATFPPNLIKPCILAGTKPNDIVCDPFMGAGTTALVTAAYGRQFIGCELNPEYVVLANERIGRECAQMKMAV